MSRSNYKNISLKRNPPKWFVEYYFRIPQEFAEEYNFKQWKRFKVYEGINYYKGEEKEKFGIELLKNVSLDLIAGFDPFKLEKTQSIVLSNIIERQKIKKPTFVKAMSEFLLQKEENGVRLTAVNIYTKKVEELIALGESKRSEYKSTLRFCLRQKSPQNYIEHSVLKTIAAFLNSEGGTLLVGVDDNGNLLGLADDYSTFGKNKNHQDEFTKHFDNLLSHYFPNAQIGNIELNITTIEDKRIAIIDVKSASTPVFMKNKAEKDKKEFFIRPNGSTIGLDPMLLS